MLAVATGSVDSDEAIVGLMARHIVHQHQFSSFYWGQNYGGSLTAIVMAAVFAVFGSSTATLKVVPIGMSAVAAILVWRLGRRTIGEPGATLAALAFWVWPANYVLLSTKERGFYWMCMILGLSFLLAVLRLVDHPDRWGEWIVLGILGGLGWWTSPQILYFVVPGLVWLGIKLRRDAWRLIVSLPFALLAAFPWLLFNFHHDWAALVPTSHQFDKGYIGNIKVLVRHGLPVALGLNILEKWIVPVVFPAIYVALLVLGTIGVIRRRPKQWLLILVALAFPLLWGAFPVSGVIGEGRYVMFILPAVILLLMYAARSPVLQVLMFVAALAVSIEGVHRIADHASAPIRTGPLIAALDAHHVHHLYGDYWVVYRVAFETNERIVGTPRFSKRWPPYDQAVAADPHPAAVFVAQSREGQQYERGLGRLGIAFDKYQAGNFDVYQPASNVDLEDVLSAGA
jgi:uncharacterized membrane protein